ncbi:ASN_collapsed_G0051480.mRNA.1.CDS.1 [Saccharomyces cerevisiae]|nr:ASN_collapsed_G0051480.mRNA.1.CDS.1 [Saccharomyces cerevisiae]
MAGLEVARSMTLQRVKHSMFSRRTYQIMKTSIYSFQRAQSQTVCPKNEIFQSELKQQQVLKERNR